MTKLNNEYILLMCNMSATASEDDMYEHDSPSVLSEIKEKLVVTDLINQMDIADGLKELLIISGFTLKSLLNTSASDLARILGIDVCVAKLVSDAVNNKKVKINSMTYCIVCVKASYDCSILRDSYV